MCVTSSTLGPGNRKQVLDWLIHDEWVIACLCAAWCGTCDSYRTTFDQLAARHPGKRFVWIDIEDEADVVGDIDVDNFPTLLVQRGEHVVFMGTVLPDLHIADRLLSALLEKEDEEPRQETPSGYSGRHDCNLMHRLQQFSE